MLLHARPIWNSAPFLVNGIALLALIASVVVPRNAAYGLLLADTLALGLSLGPASLAIAFACVLMLSHGWNTPQVTTRASKIRRPLPHAFVLFGSAALLYAFCEGTFSLSGFWLALTGARLVAAFTTRVLRPRIALVTFPIAIGMALLLLPIWNSAPLLVIGFIIGGIACSIVFPYAMSLALAAMPDDKDRVAGVLVAALMTGEGLGTFAIGTLRSNGHASLPEIYRCERNSVIPPTREREQMRDSSSCYGGVISTRENPASMTTTIPSRITCLAA